MKKFLSVVVTTCILLNMIVVLPLYVSALSPTIVNNKIPTTMKVGQILPFGSDYATVKNLLPEEEFMGGAVVFDGAFWNIGPSEAKGGATGMTDKSGTANMFCEACMTYRPGTVNASLEIYFYGNSSLEDGSSNFATIKIEQPIITHNAPSSVKSGSSVNFTTAITNTAYSNNKITNHTDNEPFYTPFVEVIEGKNIVSQSNQDYTNTLRTSETLTFTKSGNVTLKIKYQPTVYQVFGEDILIDETLEVWKQSKEVIDYEKQSGRAVLIFLEGSVEEIVTINVIEDSKSDLPSSSSDSSNTTTTPPTSSSVSGTETSSDITPPASSSTPDTELSSPDTNPSTSSSTPDTEPSSSDATPPTSSSVSDTETSPDTTSTTSSSVSDNESSEETSTSALDNYVIIADSDTKIKIEAANGVVPYNTVVRVEKVKSENNFAIVNNELDEISDKWVAYDISLLSDGTEIQPNKKVKITMPIPKGLNVNSMILYHITEDMTLEKIPFIFDDSQNNLIFETNHFSLFAVAEVMNDNAIASVNQNEKTEKSVMWVIPLVVSVVIIGGVLIYIWHFKSHKKRIENE